MYLFIEFFVHNWYKNKSKDVVKVNSESIKKKLISSFNSLPDWKNLEQ